MSARGPDGQVVATSLAKADIHDEWEARYRQADILALQDRAFDRALEVAQPAPGSEFLDAGCGTGFNAIRLARKGFTVRAVDFSEVILSSARTNVTASGYADRISVSPGDLTRLDLGDASVDNILCWGVLMHVPELQGAMSELTRVLRPGGMLIVCEGNMYAADELALRILDRFGRTTSRRRVPSGTERWRETPAGPLFARRTDIRWLVREFEARGLVLRERLACQLTEAYIYARPGSHVRRAIQRINLAWLDRIGTGTLATDNFIVLQKPASRLPQPTVA